MSMKSFGGERESLRYKALSARYGEEGARLCFGGDRFGGKT